MTTIEIDGALKRKALVRLRSKKPLTVIIKGVGTFKTYIQGLEQSREVRPTHTFTGEVNELYPGPVTTKIETTSFYFRR